MSNNDGFITFWEPKIKKGIVSYIFPNAIILLLIIIVIDIILIALIKPESDKIWFLVLHNLVFYITYVTCQVFKWFSSKKKLTHLKKVLNSDGDSTPPEY